MKRVIKSLFIISIFCLFVSKVNAGSALINVSSNKSSLVVGNSVSVTVTISSSEALGSWEFDLSYDNSLLKLTSGTANIIDYVNNNTTKSKSYTYTFKALKSGTAKVSVSNYSVIDFNEKRMTISSLKTASIKIITQEQLQQSYSNNNYLKSLLIDKYVISPTFNKSTLEYNLELENGIDSIVVKAETEDSKSKINGTGTIKVNEGVNKVEIKVTAENGNVRTYIINVTVKELSPVTVKIGDKNYTVVRKKGIVDPPLNYTENTTLINGEEVLSYVSKITGYTLIALKDDAGNVNYYIYSNDNFTLYNEISFNKINIVVLAMDKTILPKNYIKSVIGINNKEIDCYKLNENSNYALIYGINTENGKKNLYAYDNEEDTIQIYNDEEVQLLNKQIKKYTNIIIFMFILIGILLITFTVILILKQKKYMNGIMNSKKKEIDKLKEELA